MGGNIVLIALIRTSKYSSLTFNLFPVDGPNFILFGAMHFQLAVCGPKVFMLRSFSNLQH